MAHYGTDKWPIYIIFLTTGFYEYSPGNIWPLLRVRGGCRFSRSLSNKLVNRGAIRMNESKALFILQGNTLISPPICSQKLAQDFPKIVRSSGYKGIFTLLAEIRQKELEGLWCIPFLSRSQLDRPGATVPILYPQLVLIHTERYHCHWWTM